MKTNKSCILSQSILFLLLQGSDINCKQDQFDKHNFAISIQDFFVSKVYFYSFFVYSIEDKKVVEKFFSWEQINY